MTRAVLGEIMLSKFLSHFGGCNAYNRVLARIVVVWKSKEVRSDGTFLERAARPFQSVLDDVREELAASMEQFKALGAAGIMMDINTGEVLAMVSLPDYETGDLGRASEDERFNRAAFVFTAALDIPGALSHDRHLDARPPKYAARNHQLHLLSRDRLSRKR